MKLPPNVVSLPAGSQKISAPVIASRTTAMPVTSCVVCGPRNAPSISSAMAPTASTSSGSTGSSEYPAKVMSPIRLTATPPLSRR
jgi:hypothetical protein